MNALKQHPEVQPVNQFQSKTLFPLTSGTVLAGNVPYNIFLSLLINVQYQL